MKNQMELSPEIVGALVAEKGDLSQDKITEIFASNNISADAKVAENTESEVNLCLPYYSWIAGAATSVSDDDMSASGGTDHIARLAPTSDSGEWNHRNWSQMNYNIDMIFNKQRPDLADHTYDGDFDYTNSGRNNLTWKHAQNNPK